MYFYVSYHQIWNFTTKYEQPGSIIINMGLEALVYVILYYVPSQKIYELSMIKYDCEICTY